MQYIGEFIALGVAFLWTIASLACEVGGKKLGVLSLNVWRMLLSILPLMAFMWIVTGSWLPIHLSTEACLWFVVSGVVGYFWGDWCLLKGYLLIGSHYGQLLLTLTPMFASFFAWMLLKQTLSLQSVFAIFVTMLGIAIAVFRREEGKKVRLHLPFKGVLYVLGGSLGSGLGLVLSKKGLDLYCSAMTAEFLQDNPMYVAFSANFVRCCAGFICFIILLIFKKQTHVFVAGMKSKLGMISMLIAVITGPLVGVGLSIMSVQYTAVGIANTIMCLTPVLILIPSHYLFHQKITLQNIIGALVSVLGVMIFFL